MGARGPVPKPTAQRRRRNKPKTATAKAPATPKPAAAKKKTTSAATRTKRAPANGIPRPDADWHPAAKRLYESLKKSGQSDFYVASDWAFAWVVCESLSRDLKPQVVGIVEETGEVVRAIIPLKGASLAAYLKAMTSLLATEGDRRRAGIELERENRGDAKPQRSVTVLSDYRSRLTG